MSIVHAVDSLLVPFWEGIRQRRLLLHHCRGCGDIRFPPSPVCPKCLSTDQEWLEASGRATLQSWIAFHRAYWDRDKDRLPYEVCLIKLEEGPLMLSNFAGPHDELAIGTPMQVVFVEGDDGALLPQFRVSRAVSE